uniref:Thioredoxin-dependent peroxide reductase, mitochondrial n=1 Tax=Bubo bubo TaxID=30461 RepID=A0A8C0IH59_BUBBB
MVPAANRPGTNLQSRRRPRTHIQLNAALPISSSKCLGGKLGNDFGTAVVNGEFKELSLDDFKGKYLVLFFYPLDFTFVCPTEIVAFSNKANEFHDVNCDVVAVSVDSHFCHLAWINTPRKRMRSVTGRCRSACAIHQSFPAWSCGQRSAVVLTD